MKILKIITIIMLLICIGLSDLWAARGATPSRSTSQATKRAPIMPSRALPVSKRPVATQPQRGQIQLPPVKSGEIIAHYSFNPGRSLMPYRDEKNPSGIGGICEEKTCPYPLIKGQKNGAMEFDGQDDSLKLTMPTLPNQFSFEILFEINNWEEKQIILDARSQAFNLLVKIDKGISIENSGDKTLIFDAGASPMIVKKNSIWSNSGYVHLLVSIDAVSGEYLAYFNGSAAVKGQLLSSSKNKLADEIKKSSWMLGRSQMDEEVNTAFGGIVDEFVVYTGLFDEKSAKKMFQSQSECSVNADCKSISLCEKEICAQGFINHCVPVVKTCSTTEEDECREYVCNPKTGACEWADIPDHTMCWDEGNNYQTYKAITSECLKGDCKPKMIAEDACLSHKECKDKSDNNKCNGEAYCAFFDKPYPLCKFADVSKVKCPQPKNECQVNTCNPSTGGCELSNVADNTDCDDNNFATSDDVCISGTCVGTPDKSFQCLVDSDCEKVPNENVCAGKFYCDKSKAPYVCKHNPAEVIVCKTVNNTTCKKNECNPKTGICEWHFSDDDTSCNADGNALTKDTCQNGECVAGEFKGQCQSNEECAAFEDGNLCNGTLYCDTDPSSKTAGQCIVNPKTVKSCNLYVENPCQQSTCDEKSGSCVIVGKMDGVACNADNDYLTKDSCQSGECVAGEFLGQCKTDSDCAPFEDGKKCNGVLYCHKDPTKEIVSECKPKFVMNCDLGVNYPCLEGACVEGDKPYCTSTNKPDGTSCKMEGLDVSGICFQGSCKN